MTGTIIQQVNEQVKKTMEVVNSVRPLPHFDYVYTTGYEPSHRHVPVMSHHHEEGGRSHRQGGTITVKKLRLVHRSGSPAKSSPK